MHRPPTTARILVVEDNEADINLFHEALAGIRMLNEISWARNGVEALEIIRERRPELVILDTLMPLKNGFEVLEDIKNDEDLKDIMVIMAMDSGELRYVKEHALLADGYIEKPINLDSLADVVSHTDHFAMAIVRM